MKATIIVAAVAVILAAYGAFDTARAQSAPAPQTPATLGETKPVQYFQPDNSGANYFQPASGITFNQ